MKNGSIFARFVISHRTTLILLRRMGPMDERTQLRWYFMEFSGSDFYAAGDFRGTPDPSGVMTEKKSWVLMGGPLWMIPGDNSCFILRRLFGALSDDAVLLCMWF